MYMTQSCYRYKTEKLDFKRHIFLMLFFYQCKNCKVPEYNLEFHSCIYIEEFKLSSNLLLSQQDNVHLTKLCS